MMNIGNLRLRVLEGPYGRVTPARGPDGQAWPHIHYVVVLEALAAVSGDHEHWRTVWQGDYCLGVGHVDPKKTPRLWHGSFAGSDVEAMANLASTWARRPQAAFRDKELWARTAAVLAKHQSVAPALCDVLHSLLLDGSAFFDAQAFEDWCSDLGFNSDSITDHKAYQTCLETGRALTAALGAAEIERLRLEFQDY